ncbi:MAG: hypothetical protein R2800_09920 [Flavipsychrobacter sp.]
MYILKKSYHYLKNNIKQHCPSIKYIDVWNNQTANRPKEDAYPTPAVFIEFIGFNFIDKNKGVVQVGEDGFIIYHVEQEKVSESWSTDEAESPSQADADERWDVLQEIHLATQGIKTTFLKDVSRANIETDYDHDSLLNDGVAYRATMIDEPDENSGEFIHLNKYTDANINSIKTEKGKAPDTVPGDSLGYEVET